MFHDLAHLDWVDWFFISTAIGSLVWGAVFNLV